MKKILTTISFILGILLTACSTETELQTTQDNWVTLKADLLSEGDFTLLTPSEWKFEQGVGTDSQVGTISGDGITLLFSYGGFTGNPIDAIGSGERLKAQNEVIDGREAVIITPKITGDGEVAIYFVSPYGKDDTYIFDEEHFLL